MTRSTTLALSIALASALTTASLALTGEASADASTKTRSTTRNTDRTAADAGAEARTSLDEQGLEATLSAIAKARQHISTLRADFTQTRTLTLLATAVKSTGRLTFVAPDKLRWELFAPDDVVYWVGPQGLSFRTRSSKATLTRPDEKVTRGLEDLRALLGGDLRSLRARYVLSGSKGASDVEISGSARDPKAKLRGFSLTLALDLASPRRARLFEGKSDSVVISFTSARIDGPVDPHTMQP